MNLFVRHLGMAVLCALGWGLTACATTKAVEAAPTPPAPAAARAPLNLAAISWEKNLDRVLAMMALRQLQNKGVAVALYPEGSTANAPVAVLTAAPEPVTTDAEYRIRLELEIQPVIGANSAGQKPLWSASEVVTLDGKNGSLEAYAKGLATAVARLVEAYVRRSEP